MSQRDTIQGILSEGSKCIDLIDAEMIIAHALQKDRVFVMTHHKDILDNAVAREIRDLYKKRSHGYPLAYIIGEKEFYNRRFFVSEDTLIPRPETEILIDHVLKVFQNNNMKNYQLIDIGTGSGIIPITLAKEVDHDDISLECTACDISQEALAIAKKNIIRNDIENIALIESNLLESPAIKKIITNSDSGIIITANLPYVPMSDKEALLKNKKSKSLFYEPEISLWSEQNGTAHYRELIHQLHDLLNTKGDLSHQTIHIFFEIDPSQASDLAALMNQEPFTTNIAVHKDLSQKDRVIQWTLQT